MDRGPSPDASDDRAVVTLLVDIGATSRIHGARAVADFRCGPGYRLPVLRGDVLGLLADRDANPDFRRALQVVERVGKLQSAFER